MGQGFRSNEFCFREIQKRGAGTDEVQLVTPVGTGVSLGSKYSLSALPRHSRGKHRVQTGGTEYEE